MNDTLGIIGSGSLGGAVARLAVNAGIDVVLSNSRGPETLRGLTDHLGPRARAATPAEAAAAGDWTVVAVPFSAVPHLPADALAGKIVIDANNYYRSRDGVIAALPADGLTAGELFQRYVPEARAIKTFSTIYFEHLITLARPAGSPTAAPFRSPATTTRPRSPSPPCSTGSATTPSTPAPRRRAGASRTATPPGFSPIWRIPDCPGLRTRESRPASRRFVRPWRKHTTSPDEDVSDPGEEAGQQSRSRPSARSASTPSHT
ncbi:NAD(P)-binding domain-containing protein [Streptomyces sp. CA-179760]|uniref:NADPH-dependent F420 reductase n=1 Tax=Streptomyces sp. CA-179760 TaxID=3240054 RepID=UPI003D933331